MRRAWAAYARLQATATRNSNAEATGIGQDGSWNGPVIQRAAVGGCAATASNARSVGVTALPASVDGAARDADRGPSPRATSRGATSGSSTMSSETACVDERSEVIDPGGADARADDAGPLDPGADEPASPADGAGSGEPGEGGGGLWRSGEPATDSG